MTAPRIRVRKDSGPDEAHPWHYSVEWPEPEGDSMDYGSLATWEEAMTCALDSLRETEAFLAERERLVDWHRKPAV